MEHLRPLNVLQKTSEVGGKAASLSQLIAHGLRVPSGFTIHKDVLKLYRQTGALSETFLKGLGKRLAELQTSEVIVRSSAIGEDSEQYSFAGQLDSIVVENNLKQVEQAIYQCWKGLESDRIRAYQTYTGKSLSEMGVVVQEFITADYSGVTFTQSPHQNSEVYTEYVSGAGEQLVSGKVTPRSFKVKPDERPPGNLPFNGNDLIQKSLFLKQKFECHLDIEWAAVKDKVYFVQARPITVKKSAKVYWSNTNLNENYPDPISPLLYSIARDSYYHYFRNLAQLLGTGEKVIRELSYDFSNTVGIWGNRIYYNMTSIHNILSSSPLRAYFKNAFNRFIGYADQDVSNTGATQKTSKLRLIIRLIRLNLRLESHVRKIEKGVSDFSRKVEESHKKGVYKDAFYTFLDLRFNQWYHASLADFFAMIHYKGLEKFTRRFYGNQSVGVHNTLIQAIPGLVSSEPLNDIYDIAQEINSSPELKKYFLSHSAQVVYLRLKENKIEESVCRKVQNYLNQWGFRCSGELMFFKKNYVEEPYQFIELLQGYLRQDVLDPRMTIATKAKERKQATRKFAWKIIVKRHILIPLSLIELTQLYITTRLCKQAISSRERVRYKQAEMYYQFKRVVNQIGMMAVEKKILSEEDDILYLKYKEIGELISSSDMFMENLKDLLVQRKTSFREESLKSFPEHFATQFGERPDSVREEVLLQDGVKEFKGLAASGGRIKARVKVLDSVLESSKLNKGDILVTQQTDPGWAMVFPLIGGLVVEKGGALSHGAIVAREFGIPAVIGIQNITQKLRDNDEVIVDGDLGKVQLLS